MDTMTMELTDLTDAQLLRCVQLMRRFDAACEALGQWTVEVLGANAYEGPDDVMQEAINLVKERGLTELEF